jgi:hypothetical protein
MKKRLVPAGKDLLPEELDLVRVLGKLTDFQIREYVAHVGLSSYLFRRTNIRNGLNLERNLKQHSSGSGNCKEELCPRIF